MRWLFAFGLLLSAMTGAIADRKFSGTYTAKDEDTTYTLTLRQDARGNITGTLEENGTGRALTGRVVDDGVVGTIALPETDYKIHFEARMLGGKLLFKIIERTPEGEEEEIETIEFLLSGAPEDPERSPGDEEKGPKAVPSRKDKPASSQAKSKPSKPLHKSSASGAAATGKKPAGAAQKAGGSSAPAGWKTYRHPVGGYFAYPPNWSLNAATLSQGFLQLVPPDPASNAQGSLEVYGMMADQSQGITRPDDPRLIQAAETLMAQLVPFLRRTGEVESVKAGADPGAALTWEGTSPAGVQVRARSYITVQKGFVVTLFALGAKERVMARDKTLRAIFATIGAGEGERNPKLVGVWAYLNTRVYGTEPGYNPGTKITGASDNHRRLQLSPDGSCISEEKSRTILNSNTGVSIDTGDRQTIKRGRWNAGGGKLFLLWEDGTSEAFDYEIRSARELWLKEGKNIQTWERS